jgi:pimeloyl-ACP methyl ester carboxylesterase
MKLYKILIFVAILFLTSCSFNSIYLYPTKIPGLARKLTLRSATDSTIAFFTGDNYQPVFLKNGIDTVNLPYTIESVVFTSSNGNKLNGWMLKPKDITPTITILHLHGNAGCLLTQYRAMTPLLQYGFQIFLFDYSGFGYSEGKATRKNVLFDANSALDYLKSRPDITGTKLVIYGQSLGGHLSAVVAAQRQADIDALVIEGAFSSHDDIAATKAGFIGRMIVSEKYAAYKSIRTYKKPVLVIHSTEDDIIPFKQGQKIYANANPPKDFYEIKGCHMCGPQLYPEQIESKIKNMLTQ